MFVTDQMIADTVCGKTFADVGPLWETIHEKLSTARHFGATKLTAIDQFPYSDPLWDALTARLEILGIDDHDQLSMNVLDYEGKPFDVVYCSGVIYHCPDPITLLNKLRSITKETLILASTITRSVIHNSEGTLMLPDGCAIFVPALPEQHRQVIIKDWAERLGDRSGGGLMNNTVWNVNDYYNWWWLFTVPVLNAMVSSAGFSIDKAHVEAEHLYVMSLKV